MGMVEGNALEKETMKLIVKHFTDGSTFRVEGCDKKQALAVYAAVQRALKHECQQTTVNTFDAPLPVCSPGEKNCG